MILNIKNETSRLKSVILGRPCMESNINLSNTYDAKSYWNLAQNSYPLRKNVIKEMCSFENILQKYEVKIYKPSILKDCNLIFSRDVAFIIDDILINSQMIKNREAEKQAYRKIFKKINYEQIYNLPTKASIEGGDIILFNDIIFIGVNRDINFNRLKTARTNLYAFNYIKDLFPHKTVIPLELKKDDFNPYKGILHLDCAFMPVGKDKAIIYKDAFKNKKYYNTLLDIFGSKNIFNITQQESYDLCSNLFSISPEVVVSELNFHKLNSFLEDEWNIKVEAISYSEISKMGGLFRCSTLPIERSDI